MARKADAFNIDATTINVSPLNDIRQAVSQVCHEVQSAAQRSGRELSQIKLVAATKFVNADRVKEALFAGITICGENRLQEALEKITLLEGIQNLSWHFIGRIQKRKIRSLVGQFELIHSVENVEQAQEINRRAQEQGILQAVLLEINVGQEESKGGFTDLEVKRILPEIDRFTHLQVQGLMAIPPWDPDPEHTRPFFRQLRQVAEDIRELPLVRVQMKELSMGMSQDFQVAIEEGATMVRVGSRIFGERPT